MTTGDKIADLANQQLGCPYIWAHQGPCSNGFDCSGLVCWCVKQITGQTITCGSVQQFSLGTAVAKTALLRGDLLFYNSTGDGTAQHVGIYDGPGRMINALNETAGVVASDPFSSYFNPIYLGARRLFTDTGPAGFAVSDKITVVTGSPNLRSTAGGAIITALSVGTEMCVTGAPSGASGLTWYPVRVTSTGATGWVNGGACALKLAGGCTSAGIPYTQRVTGSALNLRKGAGTSYAILATMPIGTYLAILGGPVSANGYSWYNVRPKGYADGWCVDGFDPI